jgi:signal transduction histidine kinase
MTGLAVVCDVDDAVVVVDRHGAVVDANERFRTWPGGPHIEEGSGSLWAAVAPERVSQRKIVLANVLATGRPTCFVDHVAGRWARISVQPVPGSQTIDRVAFVYRDVDAQVRAEEEVKRLRLRVLTVQEEERRAISQNLHDELGQSMTTLLMQLRPLGDLAASSPELAGRIREATSQAETLAKRMRQVFYRIRPPALRDTDLLQALSDYCTATAHASGLRIDFDADDSVPVLEGARATALYRLLQEGLNNARKHARAQSVWVSLSVDSGWVYLAVEDDGIGFEEASVRAGMGLSGLRERFALIAGELQIDTRLGGGTRISGSVPTAG